MSFNKTFGSMLIIAGTTIGAGMLALPLASAGLGFTTSILIMIGMWALMSYTALLMLEVHQYADKSATLHTLAYKLLGRKGQVIASGAMLFLFYALCAAYIAGGGAQLHQKIQSLHVDIAPQIATVVFTFVIASVVAIGTHSVDIVNRVLFTAKIIAMAVMLALLLPQVKSHNLLEMPMQQGLIISALPVVFTSFGFHGSIPSIVRYLGLNIPNLKKVMIFGSALPLIVYLLWQLATQGILSQSELLANTDLTQFINALSQRLHNPLVGQSVSLFADLALATSFLGVSLGLFDFLADTLRRKATLAGRVQTACVTFIPPLAFALFYPQGFIMALGYAAIALVILAIFLPVAMVWQQRKQKATSTQENTSDYQVMGGKLSLITVIVIGVIIILSQLLQIVGIIPKLG
ncbi:TPA: aromatic amino acid transport family protein [Photobacterium damselae]|uniref:Aromatic amino acid permease n=2 Tax=Photobacterium damselae TaxID=38293 RepID=D0YYL5_PHODD|nr:tyrosine-specific transport protein [Photobacterium damselae subsp. damselae CIP 102761]MCG3815394.1 amino acid permease [Photobacterium damselae]PSB77522.1 amino acid permease [Photobacterium damselae subsp. damselae]PSW87057.1 amino acid permease [Photobacterium damselae]QSH56405.1 amino acid permease [Photobacterium damselae subsp. damselae]